METPAWLREEAQEGDNWLRREKATGGSFWRRNFDIAVKVDDACAGALLAMLERQLAQETSQPSR
jgi:hypothetical protein